MPELAPEIRNAARALIERDGRILLLRKESEFRGIQYALPGGAQELYETLGDALLRECEEEVGARVEITGFLHVAEHFKDRDTQPPTVRHLVEFVFRCSVPGDYEAHNGPKPDKHQVAVEWVPAERLASASLTNPYLLDLLGQPAKPVCETYLGVFRDGA